MLTFQRATNADIPVIQSIAEIAFTETYKNLISREQNSYMMEMMYSTSSLNEQLAEGHIYIIAKKDDKAVGYVSVSPETEDTCHLQKIYVLPSEQSNGIGRELFCEALKVGRELCKTSPFAIELNVNRGNKAVTFYEHMGMHKDREGDFDIGNGFYMNDYIMKMTVSE